MFDFNYSQSEITQWPIAKNWSLGPIGSSNWYQRQKSCPKPLSFQLLCALSRLSSQWSQNKGHRTKTATSIGVQANFSNNFSAPHKIAGNASICTLPLIVCFETCKAVTIFGPRHSHDCPWLPCAMLEICVATDESRPLPLQKWLVGW